MKMLSRQEMQEFCMLLGAFGGMIARRTATPKDDAAVELFNKMVMDPAKFALFCDALGLPPEPGA